MERMDELGLGYIFGPAYSPDYNPIESIFSVVKDTLQAVIN